MKVVIGYNPMNIQGHLPDLQKEFPSVDFVFCPKADELPAIIADADVYVGWPTRTAYLAAKKLKWVPVPGTGGDGVLSNVPELVADDCIMTNIRGAHSVAIAESALAMILGFTRGIVKSVQNQKQHKWAQRELRSSMIQLTGSTLGIIGLGSIGRALAERAKSFGMHILAVDLFPNQKPGHVDELWGLERMGDLLSHSDYVVVTVPGTSQTSHMIGAAELALMKPSAMLVLVSRGGVVDEKALVEALHSKRLAAAALDVFEKEPLPAESELWDTENLLLTAHISGGTPYEEIFTMQLLRENLDRFTKGNLALRDIVDKKLGF